MSKQLAKNTALITLASIGQKVIAFVSFLFLARILEPSQTGKFFLATSFITLFSLFTDLGLTAVVIREVAKEFTETKKILSTAIGLKYLLTIISLVAALIASVFFHYDSLTTHLIWFSLIIMAIDSFQLFFYGVLRGQQKLQFEATGMFLGQLISSITIITVLFLFPSLFLLIFAMILGSTTNLFISSRYLIKQFGWDLFIPVFHSPAIFRMFKMSTPFALSVIFGKIYASIDMILLAKFLPVTAVAIYGVAYKFTFAFQFLPFALGAALYPGMSALVVQNDEKATTRLFLKSMWYVLILVTPIVFGIWLIAPHIVNLTGDHYESAVPILRLLIFVLFPIFLDYPIGSLLNATHHQNIRTTCMGIALAFNIGLDILLIPRLGLLAVPIASLISYSLLFLLDLIAIKIVIPHFSYRALGWMMFRIVVSGLSLLFIGLQLEPIIGWILMIPFVALIYFGGLFLFRVMTKSDMQTFRSIFQKNIV